MTAAAAAAMKLKHQRGCNELQEMKTATTICFSSTGRWRRRSGSAQSETHHFGFRTIRVDTPCCGHTGIIIWRIDWTFYSFRGIDPCFLWDWRWRDVIAQPDLSVTRCFSAKFIQRTSDSFSCQLIENLSKTAELLCKILPLREKIISFFIGILQ